VLADNDETFEHFRDLHTEGDIDERTARFIDRAEEHDGISLRGGSSVDVDGVSKGPALSLQRGTRDARDPAGPISVPEGGLQ